MVEKNSLNDEFEVELKLSSGVLKELKYNG